MTERSQMTATSMHFEVPIKKGACDGWSIYMLSTSFQSFQIRVEKESLGSGLKRSRYILNLFHGVLVSICKPHTKANCFLPPVLYNSPIKHYIIWRCCWQCVFHAILLSCRDFSVYILLWLLQFFTNCAPQPKPFFSSFVLHHTCSRLFMNLWM